MELTVRENQRLDSIQTKLVQVSDQIQASHKRMDELFDQAFKMLGWLGLEPIQEVEVKTVQEISVQFVQEESEIDKTVEMMATTAGEDEANSLVIDVVEVLEDGGLDETINVVDTSLVVVPYVPKQSAKKVFDQMPQRGTFSSVSVDQYYFQFNSGLIGNKALANVLIDQKAEYPISVPHCVVNYSLQTVEKEENKGCLLCFDPGITLMDPLKACKQLGLSCTNTFVWWKGQSVIVNGNLLQPRDDSAAMISGNEGIGQKTLGRQYNDTGWQVTELDRDLQYSKYRVWHPRNDVEYAPEKCSVYIQMDNIQGEKRRIAITSLVNDCAWGLNDFSFLELCQGRVNGNPCSMVLTCFLELNTVQFRKENMLKEVEYSMRDQIPTRDVFVPYCSYIFNADYLCCLWVWNRSADIKQSFLAQGYGHSRNSSGVTSNMTTTRDSIQWVVGMRHIEGLKLVVKSTEIKIFQNDTEAEIERLRDGFQAQYSLLGQISRGIQSLQEPEEKIKEALCLFRQSVVDVCLECPLPDTVLMCAAMLYTFINTYRHCYQSILVGRYRHCSKGVYISKMLFMVSRDSFALEEWLQSWVGYLQFSKTGDMCCDYLQKFHCIADGDVNSRLYARSTDEHINGGTATEIPKASISIILSGTLCRYYGSTPPPTTAVYETCYQGCFMCAANPDFQSLPQLEESVKLYWPVELRDLDQWASSYIQLRLWCIAWMTYASLFALGNHPPWSFIQKRILDTTVCPQGVLLSIQSAKEWSSVSFLNWSITNCCSGFDIDHRYLVCHISGGLAYIHQHSYGAATVDILSSDLRILLEIHVGAIITNVQQLLQASKYPKCTTVQVRLVTNTKVNFLSQSRYESQAKWKLLMGVSRLMGVGNKTTRDKQLGETVLSGCKMYTATEAQLNCTVTPKWKAAKVCSSFKWNLLGILLCHWTIFYIILALPEGHKLKSAEWVQRFFMVSARVLICYSVFPQVLDYPATIPKEEHTLCTCWILWLIAWAKPWTPWLTSPSLRTRML